MELRIARDSLNCFWLSGSLRKVARGPDTTYRVTTQNNQQFALRVSSGMKIRRPSAFQVEAEWIDKLSSNQWLAVPKVMRTVDGGRVAQVTDSNGVLRASTLLSWLPGRRSFHPTLQHARSIGQLTGALHLHSRSQPPPPTGAIKIWDAHLMCHMPRTPHEGLEQIDPNAAKMVHQIYQTLNKLIATLDAKEFGLINADLGMHNVLWHKGKVSLVDFNDSGIGPYAFCLARLISRFRQYENGQALVDQLLNGYCEVTPLPIAYQKWGSLFELAADTFRLNYGAARAIYRGKPLRGFEQQLIITLDKRFKDL